MDTDFNDYISDEDQFKLLYRLYQADAEAVEESVSLWEMAEELEYNDQDAQRLADDLQRKGLLSFVSISGRVSLTSKGNYEVMQALLDPGKATRFFPAVVEFEDPMFRQVEVNAVYILQLIEQMQEFCGDLLPADDGSSELNRLIEQLEWKVRASKTPQEVVVNELQAIDRLLNHHVPT